jgi:hypothetical protein
MRNADSAMYRAKDHGKNAFRFFTADLAHQATRRLALETGLRRAIENGVVHLLPAADQPGEPSRWSAPRHWCAGTATGNWWNRWSSFRSPSKAT